MRYRDLSEHFNKPFTPGYSYIGSAQSDLQAFHIMTHAIVMYREEQKNFSTLF